MHTALVLLLGAVAGASADCNFACILSYKPVCGSDHQTYGNECSMNETACSQKKAIIKLYDRECRRLPCLIPCTFEYNPVCGSDGDKYGNECLLQRNACMKKEAITVVSRPEESVINLGRCPGCRFPCTTEYNPVCGSDGRTYATECSMRATACKFRRAIIAVHQGECKLS